MNVYNVITDKFASGPVCPHTVVSWGALLLHCGITKKNDKASCPTQLRGLVHCFCNNKNIIHFRITGSMTPSL